MATTSTTTTMDPPPPPPPPNESPNSSEAVVSIAMSSSTEESQDQPSTAPRPPPPPPNPTYSIAELPPPLSKDNKKLNSHKTDNKEKVSISIPYSIPPWSTAPSLPFFLEVLKDGAIIDKLDLYFTPLLFDLLLFFFPLMKYGIIIVFSSLVCLVINSQSSITSVFIHEEDVRQYSLMDNG